MDSSTEISRSIQYISSDSEDSQTSDGFKIRLFQTYKQTAWLPKLSSIDYAAGWIFITTLHQRIYKIEVAESGETLWLQRGWNLLTAIENLQEGDKLMFKIEAPNKLTMSIHSPPNHPPPIGLSAVRIPPALNDSTIEHIVLNSGTTRNAVVDDAILRVWNRSCIDGPIYVCRLLISPSEGNSLIFNKPYSRLIPKEKGSIAMRFLGSNTIIPGAIKTYRDGNARMVKEWPLYARSHHLTFGEIFVCKIHRGPAVWEFVGCCAQR